MLTLAWEIKLNAVIIQGLAAALKVEGRQRNRTYQSV